VSGKVHTDEMREREMIKEEELEKSERKRRRTRKDRFKKGGSGSCGLPARSVNGNYFGFGRI
jgi:hypothetical protein